MKIEDRKFDLLSGRTVNSHGKDLELDGLSPIPIKGKLLIENQFSPPPHENFSRRSFSWMPYFTIPGRQVPIFSYFLSAYSYFSYFLAISSYFSYFLAILLTISKYLLEI